MDNERHAKTFLDIYLKKQGPRKGKDPHIQVCHLKNGCEI